MDTQKELLERWAGWQRSIEQRDLEAARGFLADDYALELLHPTGRSFPVTSGSRPSASTSSPRMA